jgi:hypothetical protein
LDRQTQVIEGWRSSLGGGVPVTVTAAVTGGYGDRPVNASMCARSEALRRRGREIGNCSRVTVMQIASETKVAWLVSGKRRAGLKLSIARHLTNSHPAGC